MAATVKQKKKKEKCASSNRKKAEEMRGREEWRAGEGGPRGMQVRREG